MGDGTGAQDLGFEPFEPLSLVVFRAGNECADKPDKGWAPARTLGESLFGHPVDSPIGLRDRGVALASDEWGQSNVTIAVWSVLLNETDPIEVGLAYALREPGRDWTEPRAVVGLDEASAGVARGQGHARVHQLDADTFAIVFVESAKRAGPKARPRTHIGFATATLDDLRQGLPWTGTAPGVATEVSHVQAAPGDGWNRFPTLGVDIVDKRMVAAWDSTSSTPDGLFTSGDRDLLFTTLDWGGAPVNTTMWSAPNGLNPGFAEDPLHERRADVVVDRAGTNALAAWTTVMVSAGNEQIFARRSVKGQDTFLCDWGDRIRLINDQSKNADAVIGTDGRGTWVIAWVHKDLSILYSRETPDEPFDTDRWGVVASAAFPAVQIGEMIALRNDPCNPDRWAVAWVRTEVQDGPRQIALAVSTDNAVSWSEPFFAGVDAGDDPPSIAILDVGRDCVWTLSWGSADGRARVSSITSDALFGDEDSRQYVSGTDAVDPPIAGVDCRLIEVGLDDNITFGSEEYDNDQHECFQVRAPSGHHVRLDLELLVGMEHELPGCPADFVAVREARPLESTPLGGQRRFCAPGAVPTVTSSGRDVFVTFYTDWQELGTDRGKRPFVAHAVAEPSDGTGSDGGDGSDGSDDEDDGEVADGGTNDNGTGDETDAPSDLAPVQRTVSTFAEIQAILAPHGNFSKTGQLLHLVLATERIEWAAEVDISGLANVTITGGVAGVRTVLDAGDPLREQALRYRHLHVGALASLSLEHLELTGGSVSVGRQTTGGSIINRGSMPYVVDCIFRNNRSFRSQESRSAQTVAGALHVIGHVGRIERCTFADNWSMQGGAITVSSQGRLDEVVDSSFTGNEQAVVKGAGGGAMYVLGSVGRISGCLFKDNFAVGSGGALYAVDSIVERIENTTFVANFADVDGGAVRLRRISGASTELVDCAFFNNTARGRGGAARVDDNPAQPGAELNMTGLTVMHNWANLCANGLCLSDLQGFGMVSLTNCTLAENEPLGGGEAKDDLAGVVGLSAVPQVVISGSRLLRNKGIQGGAVRADGLTDLAVRDCVLEGNLATNRGGAVYIGLGSRITLEGSELSRNSALASCREELACVAIPDDGGLSEPERPLCGEDAGARGAGQCGLEPREASATRGCVDGVGGAVYVSSGAEARVHNSSFVDSSIPNVSADAFTLVDGKLSTFRDGAGRHIFSRSLLHITQTLLEPAAGVPVAPIAPLESVLPVDRACGSAAIGRVEELAGINSPPSVVCSCEGIFEGEQPYDGCSRRRVHEVRAGEPSSGQVPLTWTWQGPEVDAFRVYRYARRTDDGVFADECPDADEALIAAEERGKLFDCVTVRGDATEARLALRVGVLAFFRVTAAVDGYETQPSEAISSGVLECGMGEASFPTEDDGASECVKCPKGQFLDTGTGTCETCSCEGCRDDLLTTTGPGQAGPESCVAVSGHVLDAQGVPRACAESALCDHVGLTPETIGLKPGFWRPSVSSLEIWPCPNPSWCIGFDAAVPGARRALQGTNGTEDANDPWQQTKGCADGRTGPFCAACQEHFGTKPGAAECVRCTEAMISDHRRLIRVVVAGIVLIWTGLFAAILWYHLRTLKRKERQRNSGRLQQRRSSGLLKLRALYKELMFAKVKILIGFGQVLLGFAAVLRPLIPAVASFQNSVYQGLAWVNLDVSGALTSRGANCAIPDNHFTVMLTMTLLPIALVVLTVLLAGGMRLVWALPLSAEAPERLRALRIRALKNVCGAMLVFMLFLVYPGTSQVVLQWFVCDDLPGVGLYLRVDPSIRCDTVEYSLWRAYAIVAVVLFPIGVPVGFSVALFRKRRTIQVLTPGVVPVELESLASLFSPYRPKRFWFEVVDMTRKLVQTSVLVFCMDNTPAQVGFAMLFTAMVISILLKLDPYVSHFDNTLAVVSQWVLLLILLVFMSQLGADEDDSSAATQAIVILSLIPVIMGITMVGVQVIRLRRRAAANDANGGGDSASAGADAPGDTWGDTKPREDTHSSEATSFAMPSSPQDQDATSPLPPPPTTLQQI